jgi:hypothetical protein
MVSSKKGPFGAKAGSLRVQPRQNIAASRFSV